jgi:hypothetical protein
VVAAAGRHAVTLHSLRVRAILIAPIRLVLGVAWLVVARFAGAAATPALIAFVVGVFGIVFLAFADPRERFAHGEVDPLPAPPDVRLAPRWQQALAAMLPSTIGVSVLAAIAAFPSPTLTALLGGVCAGLGVAALLSLPGIDPALLYDPRRQIVYRR